MPTCGVGLNPRPNGFVERGDLLAQLPPRDQHRSDDWRHIWTIGNELLDPPVKREPAHGTGQQAEDFKYTSNMV